VYLLACWLNALPNVRDYYREKRRRQMRKLQKP
jgi:hypothetical protein